VKTDLASSGKKFQLCVENNLQKIVDRSKKCAYNRGLSGSAVDQEETKKS